MPSTPQTGWIGWVPPTEQDEDLVIDANGDLAQSYGTGGLLRAIAMAGTFKRIAQRDWALFSSLYGIPGGD